MKKNIFVAITLFVGWGMLMPAENLSDLAKNLSKDPVNRLLDPLIKDDALYVDVCTYLNKRQKILLHEILVLSEPQERDEIFKKFTGWSLYKKRLFCWMLGGERSLGEQDKTTLQQSPKGAFLDCFRLVEIAEDRRKGQPSAASSDQAQAPLALEASPSVPMHSTLKRGLIGAQDVKLPSSDACLYGTPMPFSNRLYKIVYSAHPIDKGSCDPWESVLQDMVHRSFDITLFPELKRLFRLVIDAECKRETCRQTCKLAHKKACKEICGRWLWFHSELDVCLNGLRYTIRGIWGKYDDPKKLSVEDQAIIQELEKKIATVTAIKERNERLCIESKDGWVKATGSLKGFLEAQL